MPVNENTFLDMVEAKLARITIANGFSFDLNANNIYQFPPTDFDVSKENFAFIYHGETVSDDDMHRNKTKLRTGFSVDAFRPVFGRYTNEQRNQKPLIRESNILRYDVMKALMYSVELGYSFNGFVDGDGDTIAEFYFQSAVPVINEGQNPFCGILINFDLTYIVSNFDHSEITAF